MYIYIIHYTHTYVYNICTYIYNIYIYINVLKCKYICIILLDGVFC